MNDASGPFFSFRNKTLSFVLLPVFLVGTYLILFPVIQPDYGRFLLPWLTAIAESDGLEIFRSDFTNYTGGIISLMWVTSHLKGLVSDLLIIKFTAILGTVFCAWCVSCLLHALGWDRQPRIAASLLFMLLPSVALNGVAWGQADAIYTGFIVLSFACLVQDRMPRSVFYFCVAVSFKLQAVFFLPFFMGRILRQPRYILLLVVLLPAAYLAVNTIYLVAGRPLADVLGIYFDQANTFQRLSMNAANFWMLPTLALSPEVLETNYHAITTGALALAVAVAGALFLLSYLARANDPVRLLYWATVALLLMPFLLPKMHERFFFPAEVFAYLLALQVRSFRPVAALLQIAAVLMYSIYHDTFGLRGLIGWPWVAYVGLASMALAIGFLLLQYAKASTTRAGSEV